MQEESRKKGQNAQVSCLLRKVPSESPHVALCFTSPLPERGHIATLQCKGRWEVLSTLAEHLPRQIQGPITMEEREDEY